MPTRIIEPRASIPRLATALVDAELARGVSVWRATVRLHESLAKMVGASGVDVLLARALMLAKKSHPVLAGFTAGPGGSIVGAEDASNHVAIKQAAVEVVACFVELLVVLIGEELTMRLLHDVWQEASTSASKSTASILTASTTTKESNE